MGSEDGDHVYVIDTSTLEIKQAITILHEENRSWRRFAILATPDGKRVAVFSELMVVLLSWEGDILMKQRIMLSDSLVALENTSITFYDNSEEETITYSFPD